jgi:predicted dehydrogenase
MGRCHVEKVAALREAGARIDLAGVVDLDAGRAGEVAAAHASWAAPDAAALFRESDAVIVAVPTLAHHEIVSAALDADLDVLVEKPIAHSVEEATDLVARADRRGRVLRVGHVEWFNAATRVIRSRVCAPRFVEVRRLGPFPSRGTDVDVVRDLMIHDIDILQQVLGEEPNRIEALGVPVITDRVDIANARVSFPSGCIADLTASRVSGAPVRKMHFFQQDGFFSIDFLSQRAWVYRRVRERDAWPEVEKERIHFEPEDALLMQLRAFVDDVEKRDAPTASAHSAVGALRTAQRVIEAIPPQPELG